MRQSWDMRLERQAGQTLGPCKPWSNLSFIVCAMGSHGSGEVSREETDLITILQRAVWQLWEDAGQGHRGSRVASLSPCPAYTLLELAPPFPAQLS